MRLVLTVSHVAAWMCPALRKSSGFGRRLLSRKASGKPSRGSRPLCPLEGFISMPAVYVSRRLPDPVMAEFARRFTLIGRPADRPATRAELLEAAAVAEAMAVTLTDRVDEELLQRAPCLKIVAVYAVGYDNVDVAAASRRGIVVTNTPEALTEATADLTWALILAVARRIPEAERLVRERRWEGWTPTQLLGADVFGKTLGIIGMGRIGRAVARRAAGFRMNVLYHNPHPLAPDVDRALWVRSVSLTQLLQDVDIITIHGPLNDSTRGMIG